MDFNTILTRFGFDSSNFVNKPVNAIEFEGGMIYEAFESYKERICSYCNHPKLFIHNYKWIEIKLSSTIGYQEYLRIKRIRYRCPCCNKTQTFKLEGISRSKRISDFVINAIKKEFYNIQSFSTIAERYSLSTTQIISIFDEYTKYVPRREMPEYLCIDEKHFEGDSDGKYVVVISDFFSGEVIDVLENRQMPYLDRYFSSISYKERSNVKVFISDMYDGYLSVRNKYFPKAHFVVDLFHVIKLLTTEVNKIRIRTYNQYATEGTLEKHFMKSNWRYFLMDQLKICKNEYHSKKFDVYLPLGEMILRCLKLNYVFWDAYGVLQELLHYDKYESYDAANRFMDRIIAKLNSSGDELLGKVANSYQKWRVGILSGLAKNQTGRRYSNAIAENNNSHIQRVIDVAYGYRNFKRLRARVMLILTYKKQR